MLFAPTTTFLGSWFSQTPKITRNNEVYVQVLKEVEKRYTGSSSFPFSTGQMRTKFKRCVAECKKLALTIKTATGVKRIQEDRGYGPWFNQLFSLVQSRDSCNPELAEEPSSSRNASSSASTETSPEDEGKNLFVPRKRSKEKKKKEDIMTSVVEVLKDMSQQDTTADLRKFFGKKTNEPESMKCVYFNCLCLVLGVKHLPLISLLKVKACRWIIFPHWIPLGQVIRTISPQVQWWLVLKEFQTTVSMHQVKCINNPGAMRQIPTQLGQPTTAYEIISDKTVYFSRFFL